MKVKRKSRELPEYSEEFQAATVILANGTFPTHMIPERLLHTAQRIVCCDGAADKLLAQALEPTWIVGDLDSLSATTRARLSTRVVAAPDPAINDLAKAFKFCMEHQWYDLAIVGATGGREDHTLGNLAWLVDFALAVRHLQGVPPPSRRCTSCRMPPLTLASSPRLFTDTGFFTPVVSSTLFSSFPGQSVSIFSFEPSLHVYAEDLKYSLEGVPFTRWWQASLNEARAASFKLTFEGGPLLVFQSYREV